MKTDKIETKIRAREWIIVAIQSCRCVPGKATEREIRKFVGRIQRDLRQLRRAHEELTKDDKKLRRAENR